MAKRLLAWWPVFLVVAVCLVAFGSHLASQQPPDAGCDHFVNDSGKVMDLCQVPGLPGYGARP